MTDIEALRQFLQVYNIDDTEYTDEQLSLLISQAGTLIGDEYTQGATHEDYTRKWEGTTYMTDFYPIDVDSVCVVVDDEEVQPHKITEEGLIYFENHIQGEFVCTYTQAINTATLDKAIMGLVMYMIRDMNDRNLKSINEGDISITYNTDSDMSTHSQISNLIQNIRNKYKARVRLI